MSETDAGVPGGYTIFCDDVREERNGKRIYVGVYSADMIIHGSAPTALPKLTLVICYSERPSQIGPAVTLKVYLPDKSGADRETLSIELPIEQMKATPTPADVADADKRLTSIFVLELSPCVIEAPGFVRVRAHRDGKVLKLGSLRVDFNPALASAPGQPFVQSPDASQAEAPKP